MQVQAFLSVLYPQEIPLGCHQKRVAEFGEWLCEEVWI